MRMTVALGVLVGANLVALFLFQWYVVVVLGPGLETDALFAAMIVPLFVLDAVGGSLMRVVVPVLSGVEETSRRAQARGILILTSGGFFVLAAVGFFTAPLWLGWVFPGFSAETLALAIELERILLMALVLMGIEMILGAIHRSYRRFLRMEAFSLLTALIALAAVVWGLPRYGVVAIAWIILGRVLLQVGLLLPGVTVRPLSSTIVDHTARQVLRLSGPLMLASSYYKAGPIVDRFLMSQAPAGGLSLFHMGQQLYAAIGQIVSRAYVQPIVPSLAESANEKAWDDFRRLYWNRVVSLAALLTVGLVVLVLAGRPTIEFFLRHGAFMREHADELWWILLALYGSLIGNVLGQVSTSAFYARGDTRTPTRLGIVAFTAGLGFKVAGFYFMGVVGLAWGTSLFALTSLAILIVALERQLERGMSEITLDAGLEMGR